MNPLVEEIKAVLLESKLNLKKATLDSYAIWNDRIGLCEHFLKFVENENDGTINEKIQKRGENAI